MTNTRSRINNLAKKVIYFAILFALIYIASVAAFTALGTMLGLAYVWIVKPDIFAAGFFVVSYAYIISWWLAVPVALGCSIFIIRKYPLKETSNS